MTRYARAGPKGTHQRVAKDSTPWEDLKPPPETPRSSETSGGGEGSKKKFGKQRFTKTKQTKEKDSSSGSGQGPSRQDKDRKSKKANPNLRGFGQSKSIKIFGQFWVPLEDAKRIKNLLKKLKEQGLPRKQILEILKNDRRKAEKASKRQRDKTCFQCRQFGHILSDCPNLKKAVTVPGAEEEDNGDASPVGEICFKCGSTEHTSRSCRKKGEKFSFAKCFVCSGSGHIARQCPKNTNGIYPSGGSCSECGSTTHLKKDCPDMVPVPNEGGEQGFFKDDNDPNAVTLRMLDPFSSSEYEPMDDIDNDDEKNDDKDGDDKLNFANESSISNSKPKRNPKANQNQNKKGRQKNEEMDSSSFQFGLSAPPKPAPAPKKRKIVRF